MCGKGGMWWAMSSCQDKIRSPMKATRDSMEQTATLRTWPHTLYHSPIHGVDLSSYLAHFDSPTSHCPSLGPLGVGRSKLRATKHSLSFSKSIILNRPNNIPPLPTPSTRALNQDLQDIYLIPNHTLDLQNSRTAHVLHLECGRDAKLSVT